MTHDPFTLDLFGSSALSSGLGLGVTAFGDYDPVAANDDDPDPPPPSPALAQATRRAARPERRQQGARANFYLDGQDRGLAATWKERAWMNVAAILTASEIERNDVPVTREHQERLIRFTGFGASDLANGMFRRPGEAGFRDGWEDLGSSGLRGHFYINTR